MLTLSFAATALASALALINALLATWSQPEIRAWLLVGLASHVTMRIWPAFDSIYEPMQAQMFKLWSTYSAWDLTVILDFLKRSTDLAVACTQDIQRDAPRLQRRPPARTSRRTKKTPRPRGHGPRQIG